MKEIDPEFEYRLASNPADLIGWEFCEMTFKDDLEWTTETVPDPHGTYNGQTICVNRAVVLRKPYFLMRKPRKNMMQELMDKIKERDIVVDKLLTEKKEFEAKWKQSAVELLNVKSSLKDVQRLLDVEKGAAEEQRRSAMRLEKDIGKIRKEIGEARMREIIDEELINPCRDISIVGLRF